MHCTAGIPVTQLHAGSPNASGGMSLPVVPPALGSQCWDPSRLTPAASRVVTSDKTACDSHYCTCSLTQVPACWPCLQGNRVTRLAYLEGIPKREFPSGWSTSFSLVATNKCLQITPLDSPSLDVLTGESMFTVYFPLKSTGKNAAWLPEHALLCQKVLPSHEARLGKDFWARQCICLHLLWLK